MFLFATRDTNQSLSVPSITTAMLFFNHKIVFFYTFIMVTLSPLSSHQTAHPFHMELHRMSWTTYDTMFIKHLIAWTFEWIRSFCYTAFYVNNKSCPTMPNFTIIGWLLGMLFCKSSCSLVIVKQCISYILYIWIQMCFDWLVNQYGIKFIKYMEIQHGESK